MTYTEKDLISFGNYLLSQERKTSYQNSTNNELSVDERLSTANDADLYNWQVANCCKDGLDTGEVFGIPVTSWKEYKSASNSEKVFKSVLRFTGIGLLIALLAKFFK